MPNGSKLQRALATTAVLWLWLLGCIPAAATDLGPVDLPLKIGGLSLDVPVHASVSIRPTDGALLLSGFAVGDLGDIQSHALAIARALPLPHDRCRRKGINVVIESVDSASVTASGQTAVVALSGKISIWACERLLGAKIHTRLAGDSVALTAPLEVVLRGPKALGLRLSGRPSVATGRPEIRRAVEDLVGDVDTLLALALAQLLDTSAARAKLPQLDGIDVDLTGARFLQSGQTLQLRADGTAKVTAAALATLTTFRKK